MPDTKEVKKPFLTRRGVHYWHWVRYPWFAGVRLLDPFIEPHWTTEIEAPHRRGLGRSLRLLGPLGIAWGRWVEDEEQFGAIIHNSRGTEERKIGWFRTRQSDRAIRSKNRLQHGTVIPTAQPPEWLESDEVPLEHL